MIVTLTSLIIALVMIIFDISVGQFCNLPHMGESMQLIGNNNYGKFGVLFFNYILRKNKYN
jgi:hypothetical protein